MDIVITTFSKRISDIINLIPQLRNQTDSNIILVINGEKDGKFIDEYRKNLLQFIVNYENVFPIFFLEIRGLSKLWNTGIIHSISDDVLILNDDVIVQDGFINECNKFIESDEYNGLCMINTGFSYFIINKKIIEEINYFDERFIGFGWEDGDFSQRFINHYGVRSSSFQTNLIHNISSNDTHDNIKTAWGKYSSFNRDFASIKYNNYFNSYFEWGAENFNTEKQYPYESYFTKEKQNLFI